MQKIIREHKDMIGHISPRDFYVAMKEISEKDDRENAHMTADEIMCELLYSLGYGAGVGVFREMENWYS